MKHVKHLIASFGLVFFMLVLMFHPCLAATDPLDSWHKLDLGTSATDSTFWSVAYGNNTIVAVGSNDGQSHIARTSVDNGKHWIITDPTLPFGTDLYGVCYGFDKFVAVGQSWTMANGEIRGTILTSAEGAYWMIQNPHTENSLFTVQSNRSFFAGGENGTIDGSGSGGDSWSLAVKQTTEDINGIACPDIGPCIAVGTNGVILRSGGDPANPPLTGNSSDNFLAIAWGNDTFVVVGRFSTILTSTDGGINWNVVNTSPGGALGGVTYANGTFVAVGTLGMILTSTDGETWTDRSLSDSDALHSAAFDEANKTWIAVGENGVVYQTDPMNSVDTPTGTGVEVSFPDYGTSVTFPEVTTPGITAVNTSDDVLSPPPNNFRLGDSPTYYNIETTASYKPPVTVCIYYDDQFSDPSEAKLLHFENGKWVDVTTSNDTDTHIVCGEVDSFSPFVVAVPNDPPKITDLSADPSVLWSPNNKMVEVTINYNATDDWDTPVCRISGVTSNELIDSSDYAIIDSHHVNLRSQRLGKGNGRDYFVNVTCEDTAGNATSDVVTIFVPHDMRKK